MSMQIENPEGLTFEEAVKLLQQNGYRNVTKEANKQNNHECFMVFAYPGGIGIHYCDNESEVIEFALDEGL